ncbi:MAG TPA: hypothetical protein VLG27_01150 [Candidatus Saccharimonadia bacterium]|nr:hypothetical protein [Candidatus Saccharimonadia bacterium]
MDFLFALFFGAGTAAFIYSKMERRVGYGNTANIMTITGVVFVVATIFFYTILKFILNI